MATIHIHPTVTRSPRLVQALQARTGLTAVISDNQAHLVAVRNWPRELGALRGNRHAMEHFGRRSQIRVTLRDDDPTPPGAA